MNAQFGMAKQMLEMQKSAFDNMISGTIASCDQASSMLELMVGLPEEGKKAFRQWLEMNKKGCENLKALVDNGYSSLNKFFEK